MFVFGADSSFVTKGGEMLQRQEENGGGHDSRDSWECKIRGEGYGTGGFCAC